MSKIQKIILGLILLIFFLTRLYQINSIPSSVYWDEASIGYNAYSVLTTGHDEWGKAFPIHFRAFGEFKLPVYIYSVAAFEAVFGLNSLAVRLPAVIYSGLTLLLVFLLGKKLFGKTEVGLISAGVLSVMPWFFLFSRTGYEATAGLMFFCLGLFLLLYARQKRFLIIFSMTCFILTFYSYNSYLIISPLTFWLVSFILFKHDPWRTNLKFFIPALLLLLVGLILPARLILYDAGFGRAEGFSLIPHIQQVYDLQHHPHYQLIYDRSKQGDFGKNLLTLVGNYFSHFSPGFLFLNGDGNLRDGQSGFGELYLIDGVFLALGLFYIFKAKSKQLLLPILIIFISFIPASLFKESPHALRSFSAAPFFAMIIAWGIFNSFKYLKKYSILILIVYLGFFGFYYAAFLQSYNLKSSKDWQYGYEQIFTNYSSQFSKYNQIIISDDYAQPYIFGLYYLKYDSDLFRKEVSLNNPSDWGFSTVRSFNKFLFVKNNEIATIKDKGVLIFASPTGQIQNRAPLDEIKFQNGEVAFYIYSQ